MTRPLLLKLLQLILLVCTGCSKDPGFSRCSLEPVTGPCFANIKRYYYDANEQKCKEFVWGGCDGVVPFETLEACEKCK